LLALTSGLLFSAPLAAHADPAPTSYRQSIQDAYDLIQNASSPDTGPADRAVKVLRSGTDDSQPEILADLTRRPPDYEDAKTRLRALIAAVDQPATTSDPALARQRLHDVLTMSRYDALHRPPTLWERFTQWVKDRIRDLLRFVFGGGGTQAPAWFLYALGVAVLVAVAVVVFRSTQGRFSQSVRLSQPVGPRPAADYFAEADRLEAEGNRIGAIRALCAGVAAALAGARTWEGSPLTVREIFQRSSDYASLRPLLLPFEAAVYGGRDVDKATYERAAQVAAPYRHPAQAAA
jgi:hypothetical protein